MATCQIERNMNFYREIDPGLVARVMDEAISAHECGHAVCALANGVEVLKIQNGVRRHFALYDMNTFHDTQVRKIVSMAGPVAQSDFLRQVGLRSDVVCSIGDAAHLLGYEEESDSDIPERMRAFTSYKNVGQIASLKTSLNGHLMFGKELPCEHQHLLGLIEEARTTLTKHRNTHTNLVAALFDNGGVLRKGNIQRIWEANKLSKVTQ